MLTYKTEQCSYCIGKGAVRFLLFFQRHCPLCNGSGQIHVPQYTQEQQTRPFLISELHPETLGILKKRPEMLHSLSPDNKRELVRKYRELPRPHLTRYVESSAEKQRRRNEEMAHAQHQRQQFQEFMKSSADFMQRSRQQHQEFAQRIHQQQHQEHQQQHQEWANQQFKKFVAQHGSGGRR